MKIYITVFVFLMMGSTSFGQDVEVYEEFGDFESLLNQTDGKIYVVNFWATWCVPCIKELPYFEQLNEKYENSNVVVILASLDFKEHLDRKVRPFIKRKGLKSKVVLMDDPKTNQWIDRVDPSWSGAIPATVFYNSKEREFMEHQFESFDELEQVVLRFLPE